MATVRLFAGFKSTFFEKFDKRLGTLDGAAQSNSFSIVNSDNTFRQDFIGEFLLNKKGKIKSGSISEFTTSIDGVPAWSISDLALSIDQYNQLFKQSKQLAFESLFVSDDVFVGSLNSDTLFSYAGDDLVEGGDGNDLIDSGFGNDSLNGGSGNDTLIGGTGEDQLVGGFGGDLLDGDTGADLLTGSANSNTFVTRVGASPEFTSVTEEVSQNIFLTAGEGVDIITDFSPSDLISNLQLEFRLPTSSDLAAGGGIFQSGRGIFFNGDWLADNTITGLNRGTFQVTFDDDSADLLFFILPQDTNQFQGFFNDQGELLPPSTFGSEIFVLLDANPNNFS